MKNSNLPPGCSPNDIPGNSSEDVAMEKQIDRIYAADIDAETLMFVLDVGFAVLKIHGEKLRENNKNYAQEIKQAYNEGYRDAVEREQNPYPRKGN